MNKEMLEDALAAEKRKTRTLSIILAIAICAFVGMTVLAFCSYEVVTEESTEVSYEADVDSGGDAEVVQTNTTAEQDYSVYVICATIVISIGLIVFGVYLYGKNKSKNEG